MAAPQLRGKGEQIIKRWFPNCVLIHLLGVLTNFSGWHLCCDTNPVITFTAAPAGWLSPRILICAQVAYSMCRCCIMCGNYLWGLPLNEFLKSYPCCLQGIYLNQLHVKLVTYKWSVICTLPVRFQSRCTPDAASTWCPVMCFEAGLSGWYKTS